MAINFAKTYLIGEAFTKGAFRPKVTNYAAMADSELRDLQFGKVTLAQPLKLEWAEGRKLLDLTGTTAVLPHIVSKRFVDLLRENDVKGWSTFPVQVYGKNKEEIPGYYGLVVSGQCGPLQKERSRQILIPAVVGTAMISAKLGLFFDESTWDGSDMFTPAGTAMIFVLEHVKNILEQAKITNVSFQRLDQIESLV